MDNQLNNLRITTWEHFRSPHISSVDETRLLSGRCHERPVPALLQGTVLTTLLEGRDDQKKDIPPLLQFTFKHVPRAVYKIF